jgi:integrase
MPKMKFTKSAIDALPSSSKDTIHWDSGQPGFGLKVTPRGRKVFFVLYRVAGAGSRVRKYTIGPLGQVTLHQARIAVQRVFAARFEGRDLAAEKQAARRRHVADRVGDLIEAYVSEHLSKNRSGPEVARVLRREVAATWAARSVHDVRKREIVELVMQVMARGTPVAANKLLKVTKSFFSWCVGRAILEVSPAHGLRAPAKELARDRVLSDKELVQVIQAARRIGYPYGDIVELLALTGQRRWEIAALNRDEIDLEEKILKFSGNRTKNGKPHIVHLSSASLCLLDRTRTMGDEFVFSSTGDRPFQNFSPSKRLLDQLSGVTNWRLHDLRRTCVSGMARLGVAPHVADKVLNHQSGTISGVAAVYQRHEFLAERQEALERWGTHLMLLLPELERKAA